MRGSAVAWYASRRFWRVFSRVYLPFMGAANLAWEVAQLPLYSLWTEASRPEIAFAVLHCTLGDLMIAASTFFLAVIVAQARIFPLQRIGLVMFMATLLGVSYTTLSEFVNTAIDVYRNANPSSR